MEIRRGFVRLHRKALYSDLWQNKTLWRFFEWCLLKAEYKPASRLVGYKTVQLEPGQFVSGRKQAHFETGLSEQTIRTCIKTLTAGNAPSLRVVSTRNYSIITIVNWRKYQNVGDDASQDGDAQPAAKPARRQPTASHEPTTYKEYKENKRNTYTRARASQSAEKPQDEDLSPSYIHVLEVFSETTGIAAKDANTREGARILAQALDCGDLEAKELPGIIKEGFADANLPSQGLRGIANNYTRYLTRNKSKNSRDNATVAAWKCSTCGHVHRQYWSLDQAPLPIRCQSETGCSGRMEPIAP